MNKQKAYIDALELALRALDSAFARANAAELVLPVHSMAERWRMSEEERALAERADVMAYNVEPDHWCARLALMAAHESLHAALALMRSDTAHDDPQAPAWSEAESRARESARLAWEAARACVDMVEAPRAPADSGRAPSERAKGVADVSDASDAPPSAASGEGAADDELLSVR